MALKLLVAALSLVGAASAAPATQPDPAPTAAPAAGPDARYCLHIEAVTGSRLEKVRCWTRQEWADQDVDVDQEWAREGVAVIA
jgi:hypothetical protein